jgi:hypothetical protein
MKPILSTLFILLIITSCAESSEVNNAINNTSDTLAQTNPIINNELSDAQNISFFMPSESGILVEDKTMLEGKQLAIYLKENSLFCQETEFIYTPMKDVMIDLDGEMSLTQIRSKTTNEIPYMLIYGIQNLDGVTIPFYEGFKTQLLPDESMQIGKFKFLASGKLVKTEYGETVENYKLVVEGNKNNQSIKQTLADIPFFDDKMVTFYWIGDLDQDGLPDFLVDLSHKYSYSMPTLFLSSKAENGELVKMIAQLSEFGC